MNQVSMFLVTYNLISAITIAHALALLPTTARYRVGCLLSLKVIAGKQAENSNFYEGEEDLSEYDSDIFDEPHESNKFGRTKKIGRNE